MDAAGSVALFYQLPMKPSRCLLPEVSWEGKHPHLAEQGWRMSQVLPVVGTVLWGFPPPPPRAAPAYVVFGAVKLRIIPQFLHPAVK